MSRYREQLRSASRRSAEYSEKHFFPIGLLCVVVMPLSAFIEDVVAHPSINTLPIRMTAAIVGCGLLGYKRIPIHAQKHFDLYWIFSVCYVLPFCFGTMLILNAALTNDGESMSSIWNYQYLVALFFFVQLIHHGPLAFLLWIVGSSAAMAALLFIDNPNWDVIKENVFLTMPIYVTAVAVGSLMNRNVAMVQAARIRVAAAIGANLAHELRTPLASIRNLAQGTENHLPTLTDAYKKAKESGIAVGALRSSQIETLSNVLERIRNEVTYSNTIIDMLLLNTADKSLTDVETESFSVKGCIEEAIARYPFNNRDERNLIDFRLEQDFELIAPRLLIVHVLFNLIKNALLYTQRSGKGRILISAQQQGSTSTITVHDNGTGIPPNVRAHIFERFYTTTTTGQGAGIGLSFCRMVMDAIGGTIECESEEGEYTTFTLHFKNPPQTPAE